MARTLIKLSNFPNSYTQPAFKTTVRVALPKAVCSSKKTTMMGLPEGQRISKTYLAVLTLYRNVSHRGTDKQNCRSDIALRIYDCVTK